MAAPSLNFAPPPPLNLSAIKSFKEPPKTDPIPTISPDYVFKSGYTFDETQIYSAARFTPTATKFNDQTFGAIMQGHRQNQEDRLFGIENDKTGEKYFCVLDGHSGIGAAECVKDRLLQTIISTKTEDFKSTLENAFIETEKNFREYNDGSGTCVLMVSLSEKNITIANSGDCRAILVTSDGTASVLTTRHSATNPDETKRISDAGFYIEDGYIHSGCNGLAVSRSIGDLIFKGFSSDPFKHGVTCIPEVITLESNDSWHTLLLMSDGCDNLSIDEIAKLTMSISANDLSSTIIKKALEAGSMDNTSCLIISMNHSPVPKADASAIAAGGGGGS